MRVSLSDEIDSGMMSVEAGAEDIAALDEFAMPTVLAEGFFHGEDLSGMRAHEKIQSMWLGGRYPPDDRLGKQGPSVRADRLERQVDA